jgi:uncharacterized protein DUF1566/Big-like domain-containing protein/List-Bact-rpt repeat protein
MTKMKNQNMKTKKTPLKFFCQLILNLLIYGFLFSQTGIADDISYDYNIVDTGQTKCFNNIIEITAPSSGADFYGQDAQFDGKQPSYTLSADGLTVYDNMTDLTWQKSPDINGDGTIDADDKVTYDEALTYAETLNSQKYGGYDDWRVPSIKECYSLIEFSGKDISGYEGDDTSSLVPFIDTDYFDFAYGDTSVGERLIDSQYASSTKYVSTTMNGDETLFGVNFADGRIKGYGLILNGTEKTFFLICCRGNTSYGNNNYTDNSDSTISDSATGLMWSQDDSGEGLNWQEALAWVQTKNAVNYLGHSDWRLPDIKELQSIVDYSRSPDTTSSAAIDSIFNCSSITNEGGEADYPYFWSTTTHEAYNDTAATANYIAFGRAMGYMNGSWMDVHGAGAQRSDPKSGDPDDYPTGHGPQGDAIRIYNYVRLVRDNQQYTVTFQTDGTAGASISGNTSQTISAEEDCSAVTANAPTNYTFTSWSGDFNGTDNPLTITDVSANMTIIANFADNMLTVSIDSTSISEDNGTSTATVTRAGTDGSLTVNLSSNDTSEATVPATVTIPDGSNSVDFTINAVNDGVVDGTQTVLITVSADDYSSGSSTIDIVDVQVMLTVAVSGSGSTDPTAGDHIIQNGIGQNITAYPTTGNHFVNWTATADVTIADSSEESTTATLTVNSTVTANFEENILELTIDPEIISENGGTATGTVTRNSGSTGDLTVNLSSDDTSEATVPATVIIPGGSSSANFTISAVDDSAIDGTQTATVSVSATQYTGDSATLEITNDDIAGFTVHPTSLTIEEDSTGIFAVILDAEPDSDVVFNLTSSNTADATVNTATLTFTAANWDDAQIVTITAVDDSENGNGSANITVAVNDANSDDNFDSLADQTVSVTCNDDDPTATDDTAVVGLSEAVVLDVLDNDSDPQGDSLLISAITSFPDEGSVEITDSGSTITYTAGINYGTFTFGYQVVDENGGTAEATVTVIIGEEVTYGLEFSINSDEVDNSQEGTLTEFIKKPKIYAYYIDPNTNKDKKTSIKVSTKVPSTDGFAVTAVDCEWKRYIALYNKKELATANKEGTFTSTWLASNPLSLLICTLSVKTVLADGTKVDDTLSKTLILSPPEISSVEKWDGATLGSDDLQTNSLIVIKGKYFGVKAPKVWLEYLNSKGQIKKQRATIDKVYKYDDIKGKANKSCMDVNTGDSEIRVKMPKKWWKEWTAGSYDLVIDNKIGLVTTSVSTSDGSENTVPTINTDTFDITSGERSYLLDILDNDTDTESDYVSIEFDSKTTSQLGKVTYDKKTATVKYTPPTDAVAPYTDTFSYTLDDGHSDETDWPANVTVTINVN